MASGWAGDGAVQDQINSSLEDEIKRARRNLPKGESLEYCEECGDAIPQPRRLALPGVRLCLACQQEKDEQDKKQAVFSPYNRKGSKDSQLR